MNMILKCFGGGVPKKHELDELFEKFFVFVSVIISAVEGYRIRICTLFNDHMKHNTNNTNRKSKRNF